MARIAFFNERLPPDPDPVAAFSYELIRSLADQQHDIQIFATYRQGDELPPSHPRIEFLRPFKRWSWLEIPRMVPMLLEFKPEILHVIEPRAESLAGLTNALSALPALTPLLGKPFVVSSYYDLRAEDLGKHRPLLFSSDAVTVSNTPQMRLIEGFFAKLSRTPRVALLPVPATARPESGGALELGAPGSELLREFLGLHEDLIFVPGDISSHRDPARLFAVLAEVLESRPRSAVLIGGGWGKTPLRARHELMREFDSRGFGSRVLLTGPISDREERACLARAKLVFTASLPIESLWLARVLRDALEASTLPVMTREQAQADALSWSHCENSWIVSSEPSDWSRALIEVLSDSRKIDLLRARLPEFSRLEVMDQPVNVVSRLYSSLLQGRASGRGWPL